MSGEGRTHGWCPWWFATAAAVVAGIGALFAWPWPLTRRLSRVDGFEAFLPSFLFIAVAIGAALAGVRLRSRIGRFVNIPLLALCALILLDFIFQLTGRE